MVRLNLALALGVVLFWGCWRPGIMTRSKALLETDFATDPLQAGWSVQTAEGSAPPAWTERPGQPRTRCLSMRNGWWQGPPIPVKPFAWYELRFASQADGLAYWAAVFFDAEGRQLDADHYSSVDPSDGWAANRVCFRAKARAAAVRLRFHSMDQTTLRVAEVALRSIGRKAVARWSDENYAPLPPVAFTPPPEHGKLIPKTIARLWSGSRLRIVMLGDSIVNDTGNSPYEILIERLHPKARIEVVTSVRGGTGCPYYKDENRIKPYVLDYQPDFVIIGGISHGCDAEAVRSVVRQIRAACGVEILVMTGAVAPRAMQNENLAKEAAKRGLPKAPTIEEYQRDLAKMAREERVEFFDFTEVWEHYAETCGKPRPWFMRDPVHANERGRQILARILAICFRP
jgi:hypothetical protein